MVMQNREINSEKGEMAQIQTCLLKQNQEMIKNLGFNHLFKSLRKKSPEILIHSLCSKQVISIKYTYTNSNYKRNHTYNYYHYK